MLCKSTDWFLYDRDLRDERAKFCKECFVRILISVLTISLLCCTLGRGAFRIQSNISKVVLGKYLTT